MASGTKLHEYVPARESLGDLAGPTMETPWYLNKKDLERGHGVTLHCVTWMSTKVGIPIPRSSSKTQKDNAMKATISQLSWACRGCDFKTCFYELWDKARQDKRHWLFHSGTELKLCTPGSAFLCFNVHINSTIIQASLSTLHLNQLHTGPQTHKKQMLRLKRDPFGGVWTGLLQTLPSWSHPVSAHNFHVDCWIPVACNPHCSLMIHDVLKPPCCVSLTHVHRFILAGDQLINFWFVKHGISLPELKWIRFWILAN